MALKSKTRSLDPCRVAQSRATPLRRIAATAAGALGGSNPWSCSNRPCSNVTLIKVRSRPVAHRVMRPPPSRRTMELIVWSKSVFLDCGGSWAIERASVSKVRTRASRECVAAPPLANPRQETWAASAAGCPGQFRQRLRSSQETCETTPRVPYAVAVVIFLKLVHTEQVYL